MACPTASPSPPAAQASSTSVSTYALLAAELLRRGYSDRDLRKILGGNVLRVLEANEEISHDHA
jgi:membrane dipeptidase